MKRSGCLKTGTVVLCISSGVSHGGDLHAEFIEHPRQGGTTLLTPTFTRIIGDQVKPRSPGNFLKAPITGKQRVLFYVLAYPPHGNFATHVKNQANELITIEDLLVEVETKLELNSMKKPDGDFRMDVETTLAPVVMPKPIDDYDTGMRSNMVRVIQDARLTAIEEQPPGEDWDWKNYDYEVVLTDRFWANGPQGGVGFNKNFRISFCDLRYLNVVGLTLHEMGHGFKFEHADFWGSDPSIFGWGDPLKAYFDHFDSMGGASNLSGADVRHFNPRHKLWAGWLTNRQFPIVTETSTHVIGKIEDVASKGGRGIRIRRDEEWTYHVFYRGDDPTANESGHGAIITRSRETNLRPSGDTQLIHPRWNSLPSPNWWNAILPVGETFSDADAGIYIHTLGLRDGGQLEIGVTFDEDPQAPIDRPPIIDILNPTRGEILSGTETISVTAYDPDHGTKSWDGIAHVVVGIGSAYLGGSCSGNPS